MFARPTKKPAAPVTKQKGLNKPKTVSVKSGLKAPQAKKGKTEAKGLKPKPPPREDAGYSLYSTDSEDQVSTAFKEMETCEKILTHLKHKNKEAGKHKTKSKKNKSGSPKPKALNDIPAGSDVVINPAYGLPYGAANFLRQLQLQGHEGQYGANPIFNSRLASSTPDPEKHLNDSSSVKLPSNLVKDQSVQDVPERDVSSVSTIPPSYNHLQNMADMVDIYKRLELKKYQQLQEAAVLAEIEKITNVPNQNSHDDNTADNSKSAFQGHMQTQFGNDLQGQGQSSDQSAEMRHSGGFVGTTSLGFSTNLQQVTPDLKQTGFQPIQSDSPFQTESLLPSRNADDGEMRRDSSLTTFQHYLSRESTGFLPPKSWINEGKQFQQQQQQQQQQQSTNLTQGQGQTTCIEPLVLTRQPVICDAEREIGIPVSDRSEKSDTVSNGTDYAVLPIGKGVNQQNLGQKVAAGLPRNSNVVFEKEKNQKGAETDEKKSEKSSSSSQGQTSIHEIPERDVPKVSAPELEANAPSEGTFTVGSQNTHSQNVSDISTPRHQNISEISSSVSQGGRVVFIPHDYSTQNVIGYIPGMSLVAGTNPPISLPVTYEVAPGHLQGTSTASSIVGTQGQSVSQLTAQTVPQDGTAYHSAAHSQVIAAGDVGVRKLRYLLKELKECNRVSKDVEISRLATDIDNAVNAIPQLALTFNLQTEIDLAIQPLRSENSQLRRKLRLLNQQLKEKELSEQGPRDINFEILHLQTSNQALQRVLKEEKEVKTRLAAEVQYVHAEIHKMKVEKSKLIADVSEKETTQLKLRQETLLDTQNMRHEIDMMRKEYEVTANKLEALEKENHILQITLQQRDAEIERQQEIVETMKESISDLLHELDQSKTGERMWDHNNSYGLHKLMRIVEEESGSGYSRDNSKHKTGRKGPRTPERRAFDFNTTGASSSSTPRLTRAALAYHDRRHTPPNGRMGPEGRVGPASESELDTLVEMQRKNTHPLPSREPGHFGKSGRRRTSSSSPVRLKNDRFDNLRHQRTVSSPMYRGERFKEANDNLQNKDRHIMHTRMLNGRTREVSDGDDDSDILPPQRRVVRNADDMSPKRRAPRYGEFSPPYRRATNTNLKDRPDETEVSVEQSRYSVTDYFRKYPQSSADQVQDSIVGTSRPAIGRAYRGMQSRPVSQFRTSSEIEERTLKSADVPPPRNIKQLTLFKGMTGDQTISAIPDDDNVSSVSMSSVTTANTVDDRKFRSGIATLDANIAKLQMALQKTKSMLQ